MSSRMAPAPEPQLSQRGAGPVATVYVTVPPAGGRPSAVKVYPGGLDRETITETVDEQRTLAELRTVSSILLIDGIDEQADGRAAIRMELCAQSLAELVNVGGALPAPEAIGLAETIARVLVDAHAAGIVHGGVTPTNVLFRLAGQPVLADFGLGLRQLFPRQPEAAAAYTAPEVLRGAEPAEPADLYGLGAVLYLALTGGSPFPARPGEPAAEVLLRALGEPPSLAGHDLPPALVELVIGLLAKDPAARPGSAADVLDRLRELGTPEAPPEPVQPVEVVQPTPLAAPSPPMEPTPPVPYVPPAPPAGPDPPGRKHKRAGDRWQPHPVLLAVPAVLAVLAVLLGGLGGFGDGTREAASSEQAAQAEQAEPPTPQDQQQPNEDNEPKDANPPPAEPDPERSKPIDVEIHHLADNGDTVEMAWRSTEPLTYAVIVAKEGGQSPSTRYRGTGTTLTIPVDPDLTYCFLVQGTDGVQTYESAPRAIRGATCRN